MMRIIKWFRFFRSFGNSRLASFGKALVVMDRQTAYRKSYRKSDSAK